MKTKVVIMTLIMFLSLFAIVGTTTGRYKLPAPEQIIDDIIEFEPMIIVSTNKLQYDVGEIVEITYTNSGNALAGFVVGTSRPTIPWIIEVDTENVLLLSDPNDCYTCMMLYGVLEPGESFIINWDQQYFGYYDDPFSPSEQVPDGQYFVEIGYWKVTGPYYIPTYVPGGPPDHFAISEIFTIG